MNRHNFKWSFEGKDYVAEIELSDDLKVVSLSEVGSVEVIEEQEEDAKTNKRTGKKKEKKCSSCNHKKNTRALRSIITGGVKLLQSELGIHSADEDTMTQRKKLCEGCEHYDFGVCGSCGCFCSAKVKLKTEKCPEGKW